MKKSILSTLIIVTGSIMLASFSANAFYGEGTSNVVDASAGNGPYCEANFEQEGQNHIIYSTEPVSIRLHENKKFMFGTCKFIDRSGVSADRAESLSHAACTIVDESGNEYVGEGRAVAANNETTGEPCGPDECEWGNVTIQCKALKEQPE